MWKRRRGGRETHHARGGTASTEDVYYAHHSPALVFMERGKDTLLSAGNILSNSTDDLFLSNQIVGNDQFLIDWEDQICKYFSNIIKGHSSGSYWLASFSVASSNTNQWHFLKFFFHNFVLSKLRGIRGFLLARMGYSHCNLLLEFTFVLDVLLRDAGVRKEDFLRFVTLNWSTIFLFQTEIPVVEDVPALNPRVEE